MALKIILHAPVYKTVECVQSAYLIEKERENKATGIEAMWWDYELEILIANMHPSLILFLSLSYNFYGCL